MSGFLQRLGLGSARASGSEDYRSEPTKNLNDQKDLMMDLISQCSSSSQQLSGVPEVKRLVVKTALDKLFTDNHFNVCTFDKVLEVLGRKCNTEAYKQLRALHCVDYAAMPEELKLVLPHLVNEALRLNDVNLATDAALEGVF
jgi:hypothetical protein